MVMHEDAGRRGALRIQYPAHLAPEVSIDTARFTVVDLSVSGCQLALTGASRYRVGDFVRGTLRFRDGVTRLVEGNVARFTEGGFAIQFTRELPQGFLDKEAALFGGEARDRRRFYRLRYPEHRRPSLAQGMDADAITEISEAAIAIFCPTFGRYMKGQAIMASVQFQDGETCTVSGSVYRLSAQDVIIVLNQLIPMARVVREQQNLLQGRR